MTHRIAAIATLFAAVVTLSGCPLFPKTVDFVDLERYTGLWYQVAGYPFGPSDGLVGITAEYALRSDGRISVTNAGFEGDFDGPQDVFEAVATVVDRHTNARLAVGLGLLPANRPGIGNYWVIDLDADEYQWAVVTDPLRRTLFILSREPALDGEVLDAILDRLDEQKFDLDRVILIPQHEDNGEV